MPKIYKVGGCVRDYLLGLEPSDIDYVVVGSSEQEMISLGYKKVESTFPVFLHPETGEEYALARQERKNSKGGYHGFDVTFDKNVTLEDDLRRRDLTINAMAKDIETGEIIDPFNGREHLELGYLQHTSEAFKDDPVRVLRLSRFAAKFLFMTTYYTIDFARQMVDSGELESLTSERIFKEMEKTLSLRNANLFFITLQSFGALKVVFPEVYALKDIPAGPEQYHGEGDSFTHTMMVMDQASKFNNPLVTFGALCHDFGKAVTLKEKLPSHPGHEEAGVPIVEAFCNRLKMPTEYKRIGVLCARHHMHVHKTFEISPKSFVRYYNDFNKGHFEHDVDILVKVAEADHFGRISIDNPPDKGYPEGEAFKKILTAIHKVKLSDNFTIEEIKEMTPDLIKQKFHMMKCSAARKALKEIKDGLIDRP